MTQPSPPPPRSSAPRAPGSDVQGPPPGPDSLRGPARIVLVLAVLTLAAELLMLVLSMTQGAWGFVFYLAGVAVVGTVVAEAALVVAVIGLAARSRLGARRFRRLPLLALLVVVGGALLASFSSLLPALHAALLPDGSVAAGYGFAVVAQLLLVEGVKIAAAAVVVVISALLMRAAPPRAELRVPVGVVPVAVVLAACSLLGGALPILRGGVLGAPDVDYPTYLVVNGVITTASGLLGAVLLLLLGLLVLLTTGPARTAAWTALGLSLLSGLLTTALIQLTSAIIVSSEFGSPQWLSAISLIPTVLGALAVAVCAVVALVPNRRVGVTAGSAP